MGGLLLAFAGGMVSFLSPCVLPLVPGYLSLMSGVGTSQLSAPDGPQTRALVRSTLLFVAGFALVFVALGAAATSLGQVLGRSRPELERVAGIVIILMGLFLAGVVAPGFLQRDRRFHILPEQLGVFAPPVMGMAFAFGWTPCIGPILASVLAAASNEGTVGRGVALLLAYSLGLGVPFVLTGVAFARFASVFGWVKRHFRAMNTTAGLLLIAFGVILATGRLGRLSGRLIEVMEALGLERLTRI